MVEFFFFASFYGIGIGVFFFSGTFWVWWGRFWFFGICFRGFLFVFFVFVSGMIGCDGSYWKSEKRAGRWVLDALCLYDVEPGYDRIW